jgi:hypothetical protein
MKDCSLYDLAGNRIPVEHDFVRGFCKRCGEIEPKVSKETQLKYSGKSKTPYGGYESR